MPVSRRYELLGWAAKSDHHYIIEDDYDSELRLGGKPFSDTAEYRRSDKVIYMNTFTKNTCLHGTDQLYGASADISGEIFIASCRFIPAPSPTLSSTHWQSLLRMAVSKNISTGCETIIRTNEI